jgi:hypothetical protein
VGKKIPPSIILGCPFIKLYKFFGVSVPIHHVQPWWEMLDFTIFPTKYDGDSGIDTYCCTSYLIINVLIKINLEDLTVKNILR